MPHRLSSRKRNALLIAVLITLAVVAAAFGVVLRSWIDNANEANYADHLRSCRAQNQSRVQANVRAEIVRGLFTGTIRLPNGGVIRVEPRAHTGAAQLKAINQALDSTKRGQVPCLRVVRKP